MYQVNVLSNEEFDALPYPEMNTSLGVADPKTKTAYVRYTGLDVLDSHLINHELEHLIEGHGGEHSNHYRNGVYYKGFGEVLQSIAPALSFIPGVGPAASIGAGVGGTLASKRQKPSGDQPQFQPQGSPMESFQAPEAPKPNIVTPSGFGGEQMGTGSNAISGMSGGGSPIERVRGFFSSRNPQGAL